MKTFFRWGLLVGGIVVLVGIIYKVFFQIWPFYFSQYPMWGLRGHYFGPRMWSVFPFLGMLLLMVAGILVAKCFFQALRDSSMPKKEELASCPYCGKDLRQGRAISDVQAERL